VDDTPAGLDTPGRRALYNNLADASAQAGEPMHDENVAYTVTPADAAELALRIDEAVKQARPDTGLTPTRRSIPYLRNLRKVDATSVTHSVLLCALASQREISCISIPYALRLRSLAFGPTVCSIS
jgi:hypothetical protein